MATKKVSALTELTSPDGSEELLVNDGGTSKKVTIDNLLYDESIDSDHYVDGSIDNAHLADDAVGVDELSATGTASSSTFLRGDNAWATPTDTNTMGSGFTVSATTDSNATTITQGDDLMIAAGTGITTETTADGTVTITNTVSDTNTNQLTTFTVSATTDSNATTISQGDDLMFTAGTGITCETTADGTVTISNTVTDTNTMGSGFTVSATTDTNATTITQGDDLMFTAGTGITCETTADGTVTITNVIADNAVGLAQMAGGTDGNIISYDSSGDPVAIATGNDGQILTSAGAGAQPAFEDAPQGVSNSKLFYFGSFS